MPSVPLRFRRFVSGIFVLCMMAVCMSCDQPFDPSGASNPQLVMFSVLATDRSVQFVRVERTYMPTGYDPLTYVADNFVAGANVTLSDDDSTFQFNDTTLARADTCRFKLPLRAYAYGPFVPRYGRQYKVTVQSVDFGTVSGNVTMPTKAHLAFGASAGEVMDHPGSHPKGDPIPVEILLSDFTKGYIARLFIDYVVYLGDQWVAERAEVPARFTNSGTEDFRWVTYGELTRRPTGDNIVQSFSNELYGLALINIVYSKYPTNKVVFNRLVYQFLQAEENLYNYYLLAHAFEDPHSTRLDEPFFSNVAGGVGVVGSYTVDSLVDILPENFVYNRR